MSQFVYYELCVVCYVSVSCVMYCVAEWSDCGQTVGLDSFYAPSMRNINRQDLIQTMDDISVAKNGPALWLANTLNVFIGSCTLQKKPHCYEPRCGNSDTYTSDKSHMLAAMITLTIGPKIQYNAIYSCDSNRFCSFVFG